VSPDSVVGGGAVALTMVVFTLLYLVLAVAWFYLMKKYTAKGLVTDEVIPDPGNDADESKPLAFAY
jgi:cytochrome d ubiquinol oxidase subunit I